jgi:hypothetical protein
MIWFRQNRFLGSFLIGLAIGTLVLGYFLFHAKGRFDEEKDRYQNVAAKLIELEGKAPFPNDANFQKAKAQTGLYAEAVASLESELKTRVLPVQPLAPNEFQGQLRQAVTAVTDKARANKIKLPENFYLGFDDFATSLPNTNATPLLGQQLKAVEMLVDILLEAHVDAITAFHRTPLREEKGAPAPPPASPAAHKTAGAPAAEIVESSAVELTWSSTPGAARKVLNQITSAKQQFFTTRTLHVRNEKDKGPLRDATAESGSSPAADAAAKNAAASGALPSASSVNFIVGAEHVETSARVEIVKFNLPEKAGEASR